MKRTILAATALLLAGGALAGPITYDYSGTCDFGCGLLALSDGDSVSGALYVDDSDGIITVGDITGFNFDFGALSFDQDDDVVVNAAFAIMDGNGFFSGFYEFNFEVEDGFFDIFVNTGAILGGVTGLEGWSASKFLLTAGGQGTYARVPAPGALLLFGAGLLGLGVAGRARRRA